MLGCDCRSAGQMDSSRNFGKTLPGLNGKKQQKSVLIEDIVILGN